MGRLIPRGSGPPVSRGKAVWAIVLACALFFAAPVELFAQAAESIRTYYFPERDFNIPFTLHEPDPRIEILLHVSTDEGRSYHYSAMARPPDRRFHFTAPADGWYYFIVQTRDGGGILSPENLRTAPPSIRVCVDTQNPVIESLTADPAAENALPTIRWKIAEPNLKEIWADYRSIGGSEWVPLFLPVKQEGAHTWKPMWGGELEVRMQALDQAGRRSEVRMLRLRVANNVSRMPPPQEQAGPGKVIYVKSKTFQLDYSLDADTVGPSQVASVDIWMLHQGQGWRKHPKPGPAKGPATVSVDAAGRWGFRLIPRSGVGLAERDPQRGDAPDIWVEVDDKPPLVKVTNVTVTPEDGYLTVYWKADDAFLRAMPITIFLASPQGSDWTPIGKDLPNTGSWRQKIEDLNLGPRYEFILKVEAIDEAGNVGSNQWGDKVKVDLKVPRIKHIEIKPGGTTSSSGGQQSYSNSGTMLPGSYPMDSTPASKPVAPPLTGSGTDFRTPRK